MRHDHGAEFHHEKCILYGAIPNVEYKGHAARKNIGGYLAGIDISKCSYFYNGD